MFLDLEQQEQLTFDIVKFTSFHIYKQNEIFDEMY